MGNYDKKLVITNLYSHDLIQNTAESQNKVLRHALNKEISVDCREEILVNNSLLETIYFH